MNELIRMSNIRKTYDGTNYVLEGIDFTLNEGETAIISGVSGCGKSTLLNIVGLLDNASSGTYSFDRIRINGGRISSSYRRQRANDIGFIFQAYCLIESISVRDNILMPFLYNGSGINAETAKEFDRLTHELNIGALADKKAALLSGGEKQRVAICRAMIKRPKLIIADEPTGNLDEINTAVVINALDGISKAGAALMVVTHNSKILFHNSKRYVLDSGKLHAT